MQVMYVLVNESLKMSSGKACSQVAHAVAKLAGNLHSNVGTFGNDDPNKVVVLSAQNTTQMRNILDYLKQKEILYAAYIDEGDFETDPYAMTAIAIEPMDVDDEDVKLFERFQLYPKRGSFWRR